ncbi:putative terminase small subunit [Bacillus phage PBC1]|uniref:Putative terminase small subunit n=1 Tax=Bacillus phage PBC1 TaxID=1161901 RepID=I1TLD5_9CAUD|nr:terminase small subunit [Bacillus phage PBC1]AFE86237.1 putative terminase small subunit [Bacillus phage PBC1]
MIDWNVIKSEWESTDITFVDLAAKHGISVNSIRSKKARQGWKKDSNPAKNDSAKPFKKLKESTKEKSSGVKPPPSSRPIEIMSPEIVVNVPNTPTVRKPRKNSPWLKHIPFEVLDIMQDMEEVDPLDILYDQIRLQWSIIVRAQEIMFVEDKDDTTKFKSSDGMDSTGYEIHAAWDKHGKFMTQLTAAQKELRGLIKEFMTIAPVEDERRLRMAQIQASTELTQLTAAKLKGERKDTSMLDVLIGAMQGVQK